MKNAILSETKRRSFRGILNALRTDVAGNTLMIMTGAIFPMMGLIGGGVDLSRMYMVRARLQLACDSGALVTRRAMTTGTPTAAQVNLGRSLFFSNFPAGTYGTSGLTVNYEAVLNGGNPTGDVGGTATASIPMTIMRVFGNETETITATCSSRQEIGNIDVVLALDTTGSMLDTIPIGDTNNDGALTAADTQQTKLAALQAAVRAFHDVLGGGDAAGHASTNGVVRYGIVPYTGTVNVGYLLPQTSLIGGNGSETVNYASRSPMYRRETSRRTCYYRHKNTFCFNPNNYAGATLATRETAALNDAWALNTNVVNDRSTTGCNTWSNTDFIDGTPPANTTEYDRTFAKYESGNKKCVRKSVEVSYQYSTTLSTGFVFAYWFEENRNIDVSNFVGGAAAANPAFSALGPTDEIYNQPLGGGAVQPWPYTQPENITWSGCIEERATVNTITAGTSTAAIPAGANDLEPNLPATTTATRWRPFLEQIVYYNNIPGIVGAQNAAVGFAACPSRARKLAVYETRGSNPNYGPNSSAPRVLDTSTSFDNYIDNLQAVGGTHHDIGMIWAARMISPTGPFAAENVNPTNGRPIQRHIVFMTDGVMAVNPTNYTSYGINLQNGRVAATTTNSAGLIDIHNVRFQMACNRARADGVTVWVVTLGSPLNAPLQACATTAADHARRADSTDQIRTIFQGIAQRLAGLRLAS
jgi:Flp pilus assembly protein TadG